MLRGPRWFRDFFQGVPDAVVDKLEAGIIRLDDGEAVEFRRCRDWGGRMYQVSEAERREEFNANLLQSLRQGLRIPPGGAEAIQLRDEHGEWWGLIPDLANIYVDANPDTDIRRQQQMTIERLDRYRLHGLRDEYTSLPSTYDPDPHRRRIHANVRARVCLREVLGDWSYLRYRMQGFVRKRASDGEVWTFLPGKIKVGSGNGCVGICQADTGRGLPDDDRLATLLLFFRMGPEGERLLRGGLGPVPF